MSSQMNNLLVLLSVLAIGCCSDSKLKYRFDYEWSDDAGGWLKYHAMPATWDEARLRCLAEGAVLASPLNEKLKASIVKFVEKQRLSGSHIFTGVHAIFSSGDYTSIEGVPLLRLAITWDAGEPDNYKNSERCLAMFVGDESSAGGTMSDTSCDRVLPYVCYENDTILKMTECGTTDERYQMQNRTGSCYKFHDRGLPWSEAYKTCLAEGGYLAIINDDVEAGVVREIIAKQGKAVFAYEQGLTYVGFHDWGHHGFNFMTIHGESLDANYHTWYSGQPDNLTRAGVGEEGQSCGAVYNDARLCDYFCGVPTGFLCEKNVKSLLNSHD